jgi:Protein of unknown function (DUF4240)
MNTDEFWHLIAQSRGTHLEPHKQLQQLLEARPLDQILSFHQIFSGYMKVSYRALLWMAFFVKEGGCSDDSFDYCRCELIMSGRDAFDRLVLDPDRLPEQPYAEFEGGYEAVRYASVRAHEQLTSGKTFYEELRKLPPFDMKSEYHRLGLDPTYRLNDDPIMKMDFEDGEIVRQYLPKVWARYGRP